MCTRQIIMQKIREEEQRNVVLRFKNMIGRIVYGEIKYIKKNYLIVNLGNNAEGIMYSE